MRFCSTAARELCKEKNVVSEISHQLMNPIINCSIVSLAFVLVTVYNSFSYQLNLRKRDFKLNYKNPMLLQEFHNLCS